MTSQINYSSIDASYPIAGQDNNSQGFRDNFSYIKNGLSTAANEISSLQTHTAKTNDDNNFNNNTIEEAVLNQVYSLATDHNAVPLTVNTDVSFTNGALQSFVVGDNIQLTLTDWPTDGVYAVMRVHLKSDNVLRTVTLGNTIKESSSTTLPIALDNIGTEEVYEFWSLDGGTNVYLKHIGSF